MFFFSFFFFTRALEACRLPLFFVCLLSFRDSKRWKRKGTLNRHWTLFACVCYRPMVQQWLFDLYFEVWFRSCWCFISLKLNWNPFLFQGHYLKIIFLVLGPQFDFSLVIVSHLQLSYFSLPTHSTLILKDAERATNFISQVCWRHTN